MRENIFEWLRLRGTGAAQIIHEVSIQQLSAGEQGKTENINISKKNNIYKYFCEDCGSDALTAAFGSSDCMGTKPILFNEGEINSDTRKTD